ncbi:putative hemolysin [Aquitalea magnusonii]|jgi:putative hemolysin|uniref:Hemolysin n=1 Tax=Aquitalea magnusonii TaxID=332411 RepID=A0A318JQ17_9NEIS|nr:DUF333 domain-containing protein [Aquitalea magnusonii]PXX51229.1 hypothetical protein DFR38_101291 [Aquitalea magnusonii]
MSAIPRLHTPAFALLGLLLAACARPPTTPPPAMAGMANPAALYCIKQGGRLLPQKDNAGNEYSLCQLTDGRVVEEWTLFRQQDKAAQP